jgi:predicted Zn finger-like uncharacterized protein
MSCPKCGCKKTYVYVVDDVLGLPDDQVRCAACGHIFYFEDHADEDDDDDMTPNAALTGKPRDEI